MAVEALRRYLKELSDGPIHDVEMVKALLRNSWDELEFSDPRQGGTKPYKL